jgi:hypothetical protein
MSNLSPDQGLYNQLDEAREFVIDMKADQIAGFTLVQDLIATIERMQRENAELEQWASKWHRLVESIAVVLEVSPCADLLTFGEEIPKAIAKLRQPLPPEGERMFRIGSWSISASNDMLRLDDGVRSKALPVWMWLEYADKGMCPLPPAEPRSAHVDLSSIRVSDTPLPVPEGTVWSGGGNDS